MATKWSELNKFERILKCAELMEDADKRVKIYPKKVESLQNVYQSIKSRLINLTNELWQPQIHLNITAVR